MKLIKNARLVALLAVTAALLGVVVLDGSTLRTAAAPVPAQVAVLIAGPGGCCTE